jgi:hypothetical protein
MISSWSGSAELCCRPIQRSPPTQRFSRCIIVRSHAAGQDQQNAANGGVIT